MLQLHCTAVARRHTHAVLAQRQHHQRNLVLSFHAASNPSRGFGHAPASAPFVRRYSVPASSSAPGTSTNTTTSSSTIATASAEAKNADVPPVPLTNGSSSKKLKLDLRPAPIKPKPPSTASSGGVKAGKAFEEANAGASASASTSASKSASSSTSAQKKPHAHPNPPSPHPHPSNPSSATTSSSIATTKPTPTPPPGTNTGTTTGTGGLSAAKESAMQDIHDAEAHGILAPPPPGANWFRRTLHQGIELFKFYYRGVKLIWSRRRAIGAINARIRAGGAPLARAEFRLIETQKDDINKVIPFLVIALLLEEVIPLIAIYAPSMLPSTCILPSQRARIEEKRAEKARVFRDQYARVYHELRRGFGPLVKVVPDAEKGQRAGQTVEVQGGGKKVLPLDKLRVPQAPTAVCGLLGLSTLGPDLLRVRRIRRRLAFLAQDDAMLLADVQQVRALSHRELLEALEERGMPNKDLTLVELQARLLRWLDAVNGTPDEQALARRLALAVSAA